jgi:hypothetical protein
MPVKKLDGDAALPESNLALSLNATCRAVARAFLKGGQEFDKHLVEEDIPNRVFQVAVDARWLTPPKKPVRYQTSIGGYDVSEAYREAFMQLLTPTFDEMKLRRYHTGWFEPTPSQLLKQFKYLTGWSDQRVADEIGAVYPKGTGDGRITIHVKTIRRIQSTKGTLRHNARPDILKCLAEVMKKARPKDEPFCYMHWHALRWQRKPDDE